MARRVKAGVNAGGPGARGKLHVSVRLGGGLVGAQGHGQLGGASFPASSATGGICSLGSLGPLEGNCIFSLQPSTQASTAWPPLAMSSAAPSCTVRALPRPLQPCLSSLPSSLPSSLTANPSPGLLEKDARQGCLHARRYGCI